MARGRAVGKLNSTTKPISLGSLRVGRAQARTRDLNHEIDELSESIRVLGLLEPIVVSPRGKDGKYEILSGQRRYLAHQALKLPTIMASVLDHRVEDSVAKAISVTENVVRRALSQTELIDACTSLYKKYGSMKAVAEATGLPISKVTQCVKYDRLVPELKQLVDNGEVDIQAALKAQDATAGSARESGGGNGRGQDVVALARQMTALSRAQQRRAVQAVRSRTGGTSADVKAAADIVQIIVTVASDSHRRLREFAKSHGWSQDRAAALLIEKGLRREAASVVGMPTSASGTDRVLDMAVRPAATGLRQPTDSMS
jgi:ParB family transcriptional regulator, chromosome partitioning protein